MVQEDRRFFYLGMNQDSDPRYLKEGEYIEAKNFYVSSTDGGNDNALENVKSTLEVSYTLPSGGRYKCVKIQDDEENQRTYIFLWSSEGAHIILYYSYLDETLRLLVRDNFYSIVGTLGGATPTYATSYTAGDVVLRTGGISSENKYYICLVGFTSASYAGEKDPEKNSLIWKEIGNYLNFQENNYIDSAIIIRDGQTLLFWTDNHNEPKYINVDKLIGSEYPTALQAEHFDLCPLQPLHQTLLSDIPTTGGANNSLIGKYFQFRYRWVFDDDMYGAWSPISEMNTYNTNLFANPTTAYSALKLRVYRNSSIPNRLKRIEVAYRDCRDGNSGDWYKFADIDGSDISASNKYRFTKFDTSTFALNGNWGLTGGGVQYESFYEVIFDNNCAKVPIDQNEANQLYSFCPKKAGTIAVTEDNRLVFGDIEENLDISGVELDMAASYVYSAPRVTSPSISYERTLKTGAKYKWGIRYSDGKGRLSTVLTNFDLEKETDWYDSIAVTPSVAVSLNMRIGHAPPSWAKTWQLCYLPIGIDYEGSTPLAYQFMAGADTPVAANGQSLISLQIPRTFNNDNDDSQFPLSFSDEYYVRGVYDASASSYWPQYDESKVIETIDSGEIASAMILDGGSGYSLSPTVTVVGGGGENCTVTVSVDATGAISTPISLTAGSGFTSFPTIRISDTSGSGANIVVDKIKFKKYIKIDSSGWTTKPLGDDILEVYKKSTDENNALWREFGYPCKVGYDANGDLAHLGLDSLINTVSGFGDPDAPSQNQVISSLTDLVYNPKNVGDMYLSYTFLDYDADNFPPSKTIPTTGRTAVGGAFFLEVPFADIRTASRSTSLKRPLVALEDNRLPALNTTLRWSDPLVQNTNINGLGFFYDINFRELKNEYGTIRKIFAENEYLKVLFDRKMGLLPMGRTEINSLDGNNFVGKTTDVFGTPRYSVSDYGISDNPESLSYFGGASMFVDRNKNTVLISSGIEVKPISDAGMRFFFDEVLIRSQRLINKPVIQSVYDKEFDTFILSINNKSTSTGTVATTPPTTIVITLTEAQIKELELSEDIVLKTFTAAPFVTETVSSGDWSKTTSTTITATVTSSGTYNPAVDVEVIQGQQYVLNYSPKNNKWMSFFDYKGDAFGSARSRLCSSKDGKFYLHNSPNVSSYGNFYGSQHESYITIPFAAEPTNTKNARALEIESTDTNFYLDSGTNERGQSTSLINGDFEEKEGRQWANILMDENTPLVGGITNPITQGDLMIGTYFIAKINNTATSLVKVFSSTLRYVKSLI